MNSRSYLLAEEDDAFLKSDETYGIRLELDYLKTELELKRHGIERTVVIFGGTRVLEAGDAQNKLDELLQQVSKDPDNKELLRNIEIARNVRAKSHYYDVSRKLGAMIGEAGHGSDDCRLTLVTGGGPGIMEAANRGAADVGAKSIGLNIVLPMEQEPNPYVSSELSFQFHYFAIRKLHFMKRASALIAFPGGMGTLDELFETLTLVQTGKMEALPIILVGTSYWRQLVNLEFMADEGVISDEDLNLFSYAETAEEVWESIEQWYQSRGKVFIDQS